MDAATIYGCDPIQAPMVGARDTAQMATTDVRSGMRGLADPGNPLVWFGLILLITVGAAGAAGSVRLSVLPSCPARSERPHSMKTGAAKGAGRKAAPVDLIGAGKSTSGRSMPPAGGRPVTQPGRRGTGRAPADDGGQGDEQTGAENPTEDENEEPTARRSAAGSSSSPAVLSSGPVQSAGGFILAVLFWTWVALPFLQKGPTGVKDQLRTKFFNKAPDGSWLP